MKLNVLLLSVFPAVSMLVQVWFLKGKEFYNMASSPSLYFSMGLRELTAGSGEHSKEQSVPATGLLCSRELSAANRDVLSTLCSAEEEATKQTLVSERGDKNSQTI